MIVAMTGLPGSGKSTLALALAAKLPAVVLNKDPIRAALFPPDEIEYSLRQDDFVIGVMLQVAEFYFQKDPERIVILDGRPFTHKDQIDALVLYCQQHGWELRFIHCTCADEIARARIEGDVSSGRHPAANRDFNLYLRSKEQADPLQVPHLHVDTGQALELCVQRCLDYLGKHSERTLRKSDE